MEEVMELLCMISESFRMNGQLIVQIGSRMSMSCAMIKVFHSIVKCLGEEVGGLFWWRGEKLQMREGKQGSIIACIS